MSVINVPRNLSSSINPSDNEGSLIINEYPEPLGNQIEWRQVDYEPSTRESEDSGWEIVYDGCGRNKPRTRSGSLQRIENHHLNLKFFF